MYMIRDALKGNLDLLVLAVLSDGPKHGYAVIEALRTRSRDVFDLPEGTVYPALHRLEEGGLLSSEWSEINGRRRRTYQLTEAGHGAHEDELEAWDEFTDAVANVVRRRVGWPATS
jgi:DNA-binding PadR family transcriptional regulator